MSGNRYANLLIVWNILYFYLFVCFMNISFGIFDKEMENGNQMITREYVNRSFVIRSKQQKWTNRRKLRGYRLLNIRLEYSIEAIKEIEEDRQINEQTLDN